MQVKLSSISPAKGKETESETAAASSEPTSEKGSSRWKQKEVTPEARKGVELSDSATSKEEEEEETPLVDRRRTRSSEKKKPPVYKTTQAPKRQSKSVEKGDGSRKRTKK